jgi:hypothetical protein|tara:strand:+ start:1138 stop:1356 length:219 start_codon:yes stop_codon:yes gene_type:complete
MAKRKIDNLGNVIYPSKRKNKKIVRVYTETIKGSVTESYDGQALYITYPLIMTVTEFNNGETMREYSLKCGK